MPVGHGAASRGHRTAPRDFGFWILDFGFFRAWLRGGAPAREMRFHSERWISCGPGGLEARPGRPAVQILDLGLRISDLSEWSESG